MRGRNVLSWSGLVLLVTVATQACRAAEYWVAPDGRDAGRGGADAPWATLQYAADRARPGDRVTVRPGAYAGFVVGYGRTQGGAEGRPITFHAEPGARIVRRNPKTPDGINIEEASYVVIEGFSIEGMPRAGIRSVQNRGVVLRDNRADDNARWGIYASHSDDLLIEGNVTSRSRIEHGIYVANGARRPVIRGNRVWGNRDCGIHMNGDISQGGDGFITAARVERNTIYDNGRHGGAAINCDGVRESTICNNLLHGNHARGIALFREDGAGGSSGNVVAHNTIVQAPDGLWAVVVKGGSIGNSIRGNILLTTNARRGSILIAPDSARGFSSFENVLTPRMTADDGATTLDLGRWQALGYDRGSAAAASPESVLADPAAGDYRPRAGSAAVDLARTAGGPPEDLTGRRRPAGRAADAGAYELGAPPAGAARR